MAALENPAAPNDAAAAADGNVVVMTERLAVAFVFAESSLDLSIFPMEELSSFLAKLEVTTLSMRRETEREFSWGAG